MKPIYQHEIDRELAVLRRSLFPHFVVALVFQAKYQEFKAKIPELDRGTFMRAMRDLSDEVIPTH